MATILDFPQRYDAGVKKQSTARSAGTAEVVLFPGVRYERWDQPTAKRRQRAKAIKRDTLELAE